MTIRSRFSLLAVGLAVSFLHGCGGSSNSSAPTPQPPAPAPVPDPTPTAVPELNMPQTFAGKLVQPGADAFSRYLKNGVYTSQDFGVLESSGAGLPQPTALPAASSADSSFSRTNTQEAGVDEADRVEYDGTYLYIASNPAWYNEDQGAHVRVMERDADFNMRESASVPVGEENYRIDGLYLHGQRLAVIGGVQPLFSIGILPTEPVVQAPNSVDIDIFNTGDPTTPELVHSMSIEGQLLSSRRIDNQLYLVSSYFPYVEPLNPEVTSEEQRLENYIAVLDTPMSDLMPHIRSGDVSEPLNNPEDCWIPEQAEEADGAAQLLTITRIDLDNPALRESSCMSAYAFDMYMSTDNLYLYAGLEESTAFHKVALEDLSYQASGSVMGSVYGNGNASLRMDEEDGLLRVVTTFFHRSMQDHELYVLEQQNDELAVVAQLPNASQPEPIGKPGEAIYAVRFLGDKAYIVTFERIDPLYVIDLSVPREPRIAGSLEIPGFSSYLHPMDNGFLLGVGQQVDPNAIPLPVDETASETETSTPEILPPVEPEGMKISLFDVRDPANPIEVGSVVQPNSYTPVEWDYRALSVVQQDGRYQFALPYETWGSPGGLQRSSVLAASNHLMMLEVDTLAAAPDLQLVNRIAAEDKSDVYIYGGDDRSVIHGEHVLYVHGSKVWVGEWRQKGEITGPF